MPSTDLSNRICFLFICPSPTRVISQNKVFQDLESWCDRTLGGYSQTRVNSMTNRFVYVRTHPPWARCCVQWPISLLTWSNSCTVKSITILCAGPGYDLTRLERCEIGFGLVCALSGTQADRPPLRQLDFQQIARGPASTLLCATVLPCMFVLTS